MIKVLPPIKETLSDYDEIERKILFVFKREVYFPLLRIITQRRLLNARESALKAAIRQRTIVFHHGEFSGKFSSGVARELRKHGAAWDRKTKSYRVHLSALPQDIQQDIRASLHAFEKRLQKIDEKLRQILPVEIAKKIKLEKNFNKALWKVDKSVTKTLKGISVSPQLSATRREKIASEWQDNMDLWIKNFTEKEIVKLRKKVQAHVFDGGRYEGLIDSIQASYGVTKKKARFLARQETSLLMTKYKETRYLEAGVDEYIWGCVVGSPAHPVRPAHKALEGKVFKWTDPPVTTATNEPERRNNPGQDYNCRCYAKPIVRF